MRRTELALDGVGAWGMTEPEQERALRAARDAAQTREPRTLRQAYAAFLTRENPFPAIPLTTPPT